MTERDPKPKRNCVISPVTPPLIRTGSQKLQINASWWPNRGCTSSFKAQGHPTRERKSMQCRRALVQRLGQATSCLGCKTTEGTGAGTGRLPALRPPAAHVISMFTYKPPWGPSRRSAGLCLPQILTREA